MRLIPGGNKTLLQCLQEPFVNDEEAPHCFLERKDARFEPLEEEYADQASQGRPGAMQAGVRLAALRLGGDIIVQSIPRVSQFFASRLDDSPPMFARFAQIAAQLLVEPLIGVLDAILNRVQFTFREKLMPSAD